MEDSMLVEISFMFIIIIGRWILPKGNISHSALSQLLLVYLSLASDILDLLTLFNEEEIYRSSPMVYLVLTIFSLCMFQFALNLTATRGRSYRAEFDAEEIEVDYQSSEKLSGSRRFLPKFVSKPFFSSVRRENPAISLKPRASTICMGHERPTPMVLENPTATKSNHLQVRHLPHSFSSNDTRLSNLSLNSVRSNVLQRSRVKLNARRKSPNRSSKFLRSELWSILVTLSLQDGPFFTVRLVAIFVYHVRSFLTYFFTFKNFLILLFQTYRIAATCLEKEEHEQEIQRTNSSVRKA